MRGWKLISDRVVYAEVALTQLGQEISIGRGDCGIAIPKEHTCVSRTHAVIKVVGRAHEQRHARHVRTARALTYHAPRSNAARSIIPRAASQSSGAQSSRVSPLRSSRRNRGAS